MTFLLRSAIPTALRFWVMRPSMHQYRRGASVAPHTGSAYSGPAIPIWRELSDGCGRGAAAGLSNRRSNPAMGNTLRDKTVVVVGPGTGIARAVALLTQ